MLGNTFYDEEDTVIRHITLYHLLRQTEQVGKKKRKGELLFKLVEPKDCKIFCVLKV